MTTDMPSPYRRATALAAVALVAAHGCGADGTKSSPSASAQAAPSGATPSPSAHAASVEAPTFDARWERARTSGDPIDLDAVADQAGALGLVVALDDAKYGVVARSALPRARDRELAVAPLARRARAGGAAAEPDLRTLLDVAEPPFPIDERLDPEGLREAFSLLRAYAADASLPSPARSLAVSALRRLVALGAGAEADVPATLD